MSTVIRDEKTFERARFVTPASEFNRYIFFSAPVPFRRHDVPSIHPTAFIHPLAYVAGDVTLGARVSVWPTAVIRGDTESITIGDDSNIQDGSVVHVDAGVPTTIGQRVAVGHRAIIHGSTVEDDCLIAMGAVLLNGVHVGAGSIVGAGAICPEGMKIPPGSLVIGIPARVLRHTTDADRDRVRKTVAAYVELQDRHRAGEFEPIRHVGQAGQPAGQSAEPVAARDEERRSRESKQGHHETVTETSPPRP